MKTQKVAVLGAGGQLGSELISQLTRHSEFSPTALLHDDLDITDKKRLQDMLNQVSPAVVINTAAYHQVDEIESNPQQAFLVNSVANQYLANWCRGHLALFVYISTDYVFGQDKKRTIPYLETDCPGPVNTYGVSKLAGELCVQNYAPRYLIVRSSGLYGGKGVSNKGGSFIERILAKAKKGELLRIVNDQVLTPTYVPDLAAQIITLLEKKITGLVHATAEGYCSWYEFVVLALKLSRLKVDVTAVNSQTFPTPARRPHYSVLENKALKTYKLNQMRFWQTQLKDFLQVLGLVSE